MAQVTDQHHLFLGADWLRRVLTVGVKQRSLVDICWILTTCYIVDAMNCYWTTITLVSAIIVIIAAWTLATCTAYIDVHSPALALPR
jgi:hypothetical protein